MVTPMMTAGPYLTMDSSRKLEKTLVKIATLSVLSLPLIALDDLCEKLSGLVIVFLTVQLKDLIHS